MATIDTLKELASTERTPRTIDEWLDRFNDEDKAVVLKAVITTPAATLYPVVKELDDNPYPFRAKGLTDLARRIRKGEYA